MILNAQLAQLNAELAQLREERDGWAVTKRRLESNVASLELDLAAAVALATTQHQLLVQAREELLWINQASRTAAAITQHLKGKA